MSLPLTPAELHQLEQRGARLARRPSGQAEHAERFVAFRRGETRYALPAAMLRGVRPLPGPTLLPRLPAHVLGVVNLGGRPLGVFDLARLEHPQAPAPTAPWALWLSDGPRSLVLVADEVLEVLDVPDAQLAALVRGAFSGRLANLARAILPGPLVVLDSALLLNPELFRIP